MNRCNYLHSVFFELSKDSLIKNKLAIQTASTRWSYADLMHRTEEIIGSLSIAGIKQGDIVALAACRKPETIAAIYAILAIGAVYLPIDKQHPNDRQVYILNITNCRTLITDDNNHHLNNDDNYNIFLLSELKGPRLEHNITLANKTNQQAYIMFTSGTTGRPKGVMISHKNALVLLNWASNRFNKSDLECVLASTSFSFDVSIFELFVPLANGGSLYLVDSILSLADLPESTNLTLINAVPSSISVLNDFVLPIHKTRVFLLAGEAPSQKVVQQLYDAGVDRVYNLYGPTEDTVFSMEHLINRTVPKNIPIGTPINGTQYLVVDDAMNPVKTGTSGELCLMGEGLSCGYIEEPNLTKLKFINSPTSMVNSRMYLTGDYVRVGNDDQLYFLGRKDQQIKLRGFRVELEEINQVILSIPEVSQATTLTYKSTHHSKEIDNKLASFVVLQTKENDQEFIRKKISNKIKNKLPQQMRINKLIVMDRLPLLINGKADHSKLRQLVKNTINSSPAIVN